MKKLQDGQSIHFISVRDRAGAGGKATITILKCTMPHSLVPCKAVFITFQDLLPRLKSSKYGLIFHFVQILKMLALEIKSLRVTLHLFSRAQKSSCLK